MNLVSLQNIEERSMADFSNSVDESYLSALLNEDGELLPVSDEKYAMELQLQEVLMSSVISSLPQNPTRSSRNYGIPTGESKSIMIETGESSRSPLVIYKEEKQKVESITIETDEAQSIPIETGDSSRRSFCKICMEEKEEGEIFRSKNCSHVFCSECISKHVAAKIQENIIMVPCPDLKCRGVLEPEFCRSIIPERVFERWENALSESMVLGSQRFYCPFKDCSVLLVNDGEEEVVQSECPRCWRLFCARCNVSWHSGVDCEEFERLGGDERGREDLMVIELAKSSKWKRCPTCKFYVEKREGCLHITCRCGFEFCYGCGLKWSVEHASCHS